VAVGLGRHNRVRLGYVELTLGLESGWAARWTQKVADRPYFGVKSIGPWRVHLLEADKGSTDVVVSIWQRKMVGRPSFVTETSLPS
jgi:hypothetical protein